MSTPTVIPPQSSTSPGSGPFDLEPRVGSGESCGLVGVGGWPLKVQLTSQEIEEDIATLTQARLIMRRLRKFRIAAAEMSQILKRLKCILYQRRAAGVRSRSREDDDSRTPEGYNGALNGEWKEQS